jgi:mannose/fructose/sorbose-specific phosphotransferase system IIB component
MKDITMPLVLVRIDDRLIHGQVVVGWGKVLHPERIALCSDEVANSDWQRTIYMSAVTEDMKSSVLTVDDTVQTFQNNEFSDERVILLADSPKSIVSLVERKVPIKSVNVGGMHFKPGKKQIASFIFVDDEDIENFRILHNIGIRLEGRDVPTCAPIDIAKVLNFDEKEPNGE